MNLLLPRLAFRVMLLPQLPVSITSWEVINHHTQLITSFFFFDNKFLKLSYFHFREKMAQAYDFALDKIGMEIMSYQVEFIVLNMEI